MAICRANVFLRTAERVMIQVGRVKAQTYDELFEAVKALKWSDFIPENGKFWVKKASSVKSKLFSPSDIQRIVKKAIVENLKQEYGVKLGLVKMGQVILIRVFFIRMKQLLHWIHQENHFTKEDTDIIPQRHLFPKHWRQH